MTEKFRVQVPVRLTADEHTSLKARVGASGMTLQRYVRLLLFPAGQSAAKTPRITSDEAQTIITLCEIAHDEALLSPEAWALAQMITAAFPECKAQYDAGPVTQSSWWQYEADWRRKQAEKLASKGQDAISPSGGIHDEGKSD